MDALKSIVVGIDHASSVTSVRDSSRKPSDYYRDTTSSHGRTKLIASAPRIPEIANLHYCWQVRNRWSHGLGPHIVSWVSRSTLSSLFIGVFNGLNQSTHLINLTPIIVVWLVSKTCLASPPRPLRPPSFPSSNSRCMTRLIATTMNKGTLSGPRWELFEIDLWRIPAAKMARKKLLLLLKGWSFKIRFIANHASTVALPEPFLYIISSRPR
jgi:hypothetical protein